MNLSDLFVGSVAVVLGVTGVMAAILGSDFFFRWKKAEWVDRTAGRTFTRVLYAIIGVALIVLGVAIARGYRTSRPAVSAAEGLNIRRGEQSPTQFASLLWTTPTRFIQARSASE